MLLIDGCFVPFEGLDECALFATGCGSRLGAHGAVEVVFGEF